MRFSNGIEYFGTPGGQNFAYWVSTCGPGEDDKFGSIVYSDTMHEALDIYRQNYQEEPYSIRQMADNE